MRQQKLVRTLAMQVEQQNFQMQAQMEVDSFNSQMGFSVAQANQQAAREWFVKLDAAVASPDNAEFVAKTRPTLKNEKEFRFHWRSLVGLPLPPVTRLLHQELEPPRGPPRTQHIGRVSTQTRGMA